MLLNPQFLSIFTVEWLKNVVIEYIFNKILNLVVPDEINKKTHLVNILVRNMMGDNFITISAKLTLKEFAPGYTANLPQVIIKNHVITLLEYVQNTYPDKTLTLSESQHNLKTEVKNIVKQISDNFDITVKEERS
jgi:hypothetical protein